MGKSWPQSLYGRHLLRRAKDRRERRTGGIPSLRRHKTQRPGQSFHRYSNDRPVAGVNGQALARRSKEVLVRSNRVVRAEHCHQLARKPSRLVFSRCIAGYRGSIVSGVAGRSARGATTAVGLLPRVQITVGSAGSARIYIRSLNLLRFRGPRRPPRFVSRSLRSRKVEGCFPGRGHCSTGDPNCRFTLTWT